MIFQGIVGLIILIIVFFTIIKIVGNIIRGFILIGLTLLASFLIFGSLPNFTDLPIISEFFKLSIIGISRDVENNLLVIVTNRGLSKISDFKFFVNGNETLILNGIDSLSGRETNVFQLDWNKEFDNINIQTSSGNFSYKK